MAGIDDKREQEHKQRVKKLKAKTSKMRIAIIDGYGRKPKYPLPKYFEKDYEAFRDKIQDPAFYLEDADDAGINFSVDDGYAMHTLSGPWKNIDESHKKKLRAHYRKQLGSELDWQNASDRTTAGDAETYIKPGFHKNTTV